MIALAHDVSAQGITNPAGGGVIPVMFMIAVGLPLVIYLLSARATIDETPALRAPFVTVPLIVVYLLLSIGAIHAADHHTAALFLYLEVLLVAIATVLVLLQDALARGLAIAAVVLAVAVLNFFHPKLIDLQDRRYVNNELDFEQFEVSYPGHWRVMHLDDGRILLNINPQRQVGGTLRMQSAANRIRSPVVFDLQGADTHPVIKKIYRPVVSEGTWGWNRRPEAFFELPLFGQVRIEKITPEPQGMALVLDGDMRVDCHYLLEARGEPVPDAMHGKYVEWSSASTVDGQSEVRCQKI